MSESVAHILKCAVAPRPMPATPDLPQSLAEFEEDNWTVKLVYDFFPEAKQEHALHDYHSKRKEHLDIKSNGKSKRIPAKKLMSEDGLLNYHFEHIVDYACDHKADMFIVYGKETIEAFAKAFKGLEKAEWGIYEDIMIGAKAVSISFTAYNDSC